MQAERPLKLPVQVQTSVMAEGSGRRDPEALAATVATQRRSLVEVARAVARVEDELAATLDAIARRDADRRDELHAHAAAARRYAEAERRAAEHWEQDPQAPGAAQR